jgi:hypothetical protein
VKEGKLLTTAQTAPAKQPPTQINPAGEYDFTIVQDSKAPRIGSRRI